MLSHLLPTIALKGRHCALPYSIDGDIKAEKVKPCICPSSRYCCDISECEVGKRWAGSAFLSQSEPLHTPIRAKIKDFPGGLLVNSLPANAGFNC